MDDHTAGAYGQRVQILAQMLGEMLQFKNYHDDPTKPPFPWDEEAARWSREYRTRLVREDVTSLDGIPAAVARYLRQHELPLTAVCWPQFADLPWQGAGVDIAGDSPLGLVARARS